MRHAEQEGPRTGGYVISTPGRGFVIALARDLDPFQVGVLLVCLIYGVVATGWYGTLASLSVRNYPGIGGRVFLASLAVGSFTALLGLTRNSLRGMRIEQAGLWLLATMCTAYALWSPFSLGWRAVPLTLWLGLLVAVPSLVLALRRGRQIRAAEDHLRARREANDAGQ
jgi:hypothetical protein